MAVNLIKSQYKLRNFVKLIVRHLNNLVFKSAFRNGELANSLTDSECVY